MHPALITAAAHAASAHVAAARHLLADDVHVNPTSLGAPGAAFIQTAINWLWLSALWASLVTLSSVVPPTGSASTQATAIGRPAAAAWPSPGPSGRWSRASAPPPSTCCSGPRPDGGRHTSHSRVRGGPGPRPGLLGPRPRGLGQWPSRCSRPRIGALGTGRGRR